MFPYYNRKKKWQFAPKPTKPPTEKQIQFYLFVCKELDKLGIPHSLKPQNTKSSYIKVLNNLVPLLRANQQDFPKFEYVPPEKPEAEKPQ